MSRSISDGWRAVTHPAAGVYCLGPDARATRANSVLVLSPGGAGAGGLEFVYWARDGSLNPFEYQVGTLNTSGLASDNVEFTTMVS